MANDILKSWQEQAEDILAAQPEERRVYDASRIRDIIDTLSQLPTGKLIVEWMKDNDIQVFLDYQCKDNAGGYHIIGSKTVCLSAHIPDIELVAILAHEARHAWQDSCELMPSLYKDVDTYLKQIRFIEADAAAYEFQIFKEMQDAGIDVKTSQFYKFCNETLSKTKKTAPEYLKGKEALWAGFCSFFADRHKKDSYDSGAIMVGEILSGIKQQSQDYRLQTEYSAVSYKRPDIEGVDISANSAILKIADMFGGGNYLQDIPVDFAKHEQFIGNISNLNTARIRSLKKKQSNKSKSYKRIPTII